MTQAEAFKLLMQARWSQRPCPRAAQVWHIRPEQTQWISASPLRVAASLNLDVQLNPDFTVEIYFEDESSCTVPIVGQCFVEKGVPCHA